MTDIDYDEIRELAKNALKLVLTQKQNIDIIEKNIFEISKNTKVYENFEDVYKKNVYEIINDIKIGKKLNDVLSNIKNNRINWNHESLKDMILEENEQDNFIINPFKIEEGVLQCKCGSKRVYSYQVQSRSSDEPMSTHAQCMACKSKWVYSG